MKTARLFLSILAAFMLFVGYGSNAQNKITTDIRSQDTKHTYPPSYDIIYTLGDSCLGAGHEQHDGNLHANGYGILSDSAKIVQKMRPASYPWQYTKICVGFMSVSGAPANFNYNIIMYDSASTGPGINLLYMSPTQTITTPPAYPLYQWYSSTVSMPVINSGAVYIGVQYDDNPNILVYVAADENAGTTLWPGFYSTALTAPPVWTTLQTAFASYKALGLRAEGQSPVSACVNTYTHQLSNSIVLFQAVCAVSPTVGWVAGATATVRKTINGGNTWTDANPNTGVITGDIYNITAVDANNAWVTTSAAATFIYRTTNGGTNWTQVFTQTGGFIDGMVFTTVNNGFAYGDPVGGRWSLWKTTNGGVTWDSTGLYVPQAGSEAGWNNSIKIKGTNIWFGTNNSRVYHSTNSGANWTFGTTGDANSYSLQFNDVNNGLVGTGVMNKTTNGGTTYTTLTAPGFNNVTGLAGANSTYYWFVRGDSLFATTNSGTNWSMSFADTKGLWGVDVTALNNGCGIGWAVGDSGKIIRINVDTLVGIQPIGNGVPNIYRLAQNYPNPFNPNTKIAFDIPKAGIVNMVVYDLLGRDVATLVNEFKQAGRYNVDFNALNLASGVYFYRITAGDFVETKKMLLIK